MLRPALVLALCGPAALLPIFDDDDTKHAPDAQQLRALFTGNCASCHQPPDTRFAVDRAWITQLADTA
jgi:mono/diheme cytochrome c family protein